MVQSWVMAWWAREADMWDAPYDPLRPTENIVFARLQAQAKLAALIRLLEYEVQYG